MLVAVFLHFFRLDQEGYANLYYAATVKSMLTSWHNFFFASFDPGGFVSVDKPPLGFWIQAASAFIFGFGGFSLLLPQALAGVLSVALLYHLVSRVFGATAGLSAALILAVTPISVAANRNNTVDGLLVLTSLLAAWAVSIAAEKGSWRWLIACAVFVGIGFNIKMLQAYLVLPAYYGMYLFAARTKWWTRLIHLVLATIVLAVVSLVWVVIVDATPADERPFVGSSRNNSEIELIAGHNGLTRLGIIANWLGLRGPTPARPGPDQPPRGEPNPPPFGQAGQPNRPPAQPNQPAPGAPQPPGPSDETGQTGPLRLFNKQLAGQISWLLPLAFIGMIVATWQVRLTIPFAREHQALLLWTLWLVPQLIFFSWAGLFHRYYLEMLSPGIAALAGAGVAAMWSDYRQHRWRGLILPCALLTTAIVEIGIISYFPEWSRYLAPAMLGLTLLAVVALLLFWFKATVRCPKGLITDNWLLPTAFCLLGFLTLLIAPSAWATTPVLNGGDSGLPYAGPDLLQRPGRGSIPSDNRLIDYLRAHRGGAQFLVAGLDAMTTAPIILATGEPVMALGGFGGNDNILTVDQLAQRVAQNDVRFFLLPNQENRQAALVRWIRNNCALVPDSSWRAPSPGARALPPAGPGGNLQLYRCSR